MTKGEEKMLRCIQLALQIVLIEDRKLLEELARR